MSTSEVGTDQEFLSVDVEHRDGTVVVHVSGELDYPAKGTFLAVLHDMISSDDPIVVDLTKLTFIDSSGLGALIRVNKQVRHLRGPLPIACVPDSRISRLLDLTGLDQVLRLYDTVDHAVAAVQEDPAQ